MNAFRLQFNRDLFNYLNVHVFFSYNTTSRHILKCICIHRLFILSDKYRLSLLSAAVIFCHESGSSRFSYIFLGNVHFLFYLFQEGAGDLVQYIEVNVRLLLTKFK